MKLRAVCCAALLGLLVSPALADIMITATPLNQIIEVGQTATVDIYASIPEAEAITGDGIGGLVFPPATVWGDNVMLGTLSYMGDAVGVANIAMGDDYPADLTEGFALEPVGEFATVQYGAFQITVVPEPAALVLLALGGLVLRRR